MEKRIECLEDSLEEGFTNIIPLKVIDFGPEGLKEKYKNCSSFGKADCYCPNSHENSDCKRECKYFNLAQMLFFSGETLIESKW